MESRSLTKSAGSPYLLTTGMWREMTERMGYLVDLDNPYITLDNNYH